MKSLCRALFAALFLSTFAAAWAGDFDDAQQRLASRQSALASLKESGALGENNRGFVEVRENAAEAGRVAAEENKDRSIIYAELAKKTGASADSVGRTRAKQIASNSRSGVWVQNEAGQWHRK